MSFGQLQHGWLRTHIGVLKSTEVYYCLLQDYAGCTANNPQSMFAGPVNIKMRAIDTGSSYTIQMHTQRRMSTQV